MVLAARADDEFTNSARRIGFALRILRRKPLVIVVVPIDDDTGFGGVQILPEGLHFEIIAMFRAGTKQRLVPIGKRAYGRVRPQIRAQPFFLRGARVAAANLGTFASQTR